MSHTSPSIPLESSTTPAGPERAAARPVGPVRQILLQASSFCNISCRYCYLDERVRSRRTDMSLDTVRRTFQMVAESGRAASSIDCRWHAGEPLTRGSDFYQAALAAAEETLAGRCGFSIQTNGLLLDEEWCRFFLDAGMSVGVSLDGLQGWHDQNRVDRRGCGTWSRVLQGIELLHRSNIPFDIICVAGKDALLNPARVFEFFKGIGCRSIGFNTDDLAPGISTADALDDLLERYSEFMRVMAELEADSGFQPYIRELDELRSAILSTGGTARSATAEPFAILNVNSQGDVSTCSPELLTLHSQWGPPRTLGNVWWKTWEELVDSFFASSWGKEICGGTEKCQRHCPYFDICGGGAPANKLFENGSFDTTETFFCRSRVQSLAPLVLTLIESRQGYAQLAHNHAIQGDRRGTSI